MGTSQGWDSSKQWALSIYVETRDKGATLLLDQRKWAIPS